MEIDKINLLKNGYAISKINDQNFMSYLKDIKKELNLINTNIGDTFNGYSTCVNDMISKDLLNKIETFVFDKINNNSIKKYFFPFKPKLIDVEVSIASYNQERVNNPIKAQLWHRDYDDIFKQLKFFIPLHNINEENGKLSVASKHICKFNQSLIEIIDGKENIRITDKTFRKNISTNYIFDKDIEFGDILLADTNNCYHKGALIKKQNSVRYMITATLGGPGNSGNLQENKLVNKKYRFDKLIITKILKNIRSRLDYNFKLFRNSNKKIILN